MPTTSLTIVNEALQLVGDNQKPVTGTAPTFDESPAGKAAQLLYTPCVQAVARQFEWDFARNTVALELSGNAAPFPWTLEYLYPTNGIQVWTLMPSQQGDRFDPLPFNFAVANATVGDATRKVIHTDLQDALAVFNNSPSEELWDADFHQAVVRLLASEFATALAGKPDLAAGLGSSYGTFEQIGESRQD